MSSIVRAAGLTGFQPLVQSLGGSASVILRRVGLSVGDFADPDRYLPYSNVLLAIEEAARALEVPDFGLRLADAQDVSILGILALAIKSAASLRDSMLLAAKYMHFHTPGLVFEDFRSDDGATECFKFAFFEGAPPAPQAIEHVVGHMCRLVALLSDRRARPVGIHLRHARIGSNRQYQQHLGQLPRFNAAFDGISVDPLEWRRPLRTHNAELQAFVPAGHTAAAGPAGGGAGARGAARSHPRQPGGPGRRGAHPGAAPAHVAAPIARRRLCL
jgi:hypothetical protein